MVNSIVLENGDVVYFKFSKRALANAEAKLGFSITELSDKPKISSLAVLVLEAIQVGSKLQGVAPIAKTIDELYDLDDKYDLIDLIYTDKEDLEKKPIES